MKTKQKPQPKSRNLCASVEAQCHLLFLVPKQSLGTSGKDVIVQLRDSTSVSRREGPFKRGKRLPVASGLKTTTMGAPK